jgi:hypothetical protein
MIDSNESTKRAERMGPTGDGDAKRMVQELAATLQRTLAESPQVAKHLSRIKAAGYETSLVIEATIGLRRAGAGEPRGFDFRVEQDEADPLKMTPLDKKFLRSLKISVEEDE